VAPPSTSPVHYSTTLTACQYLLHPSVRCSAATPLGRAQRRFAHACEVRFDAAQEDAVGGAGRRLTERASAELGIEWKDMISCRAACDRIAMIERLVGFGRLRRTKAGRPDVLRVAPWWCPSVVWLILPIKSIPGARRPRLGL
jgi:hypothetical protein